MKKNDFSIKFIVLSFAVMAIVSVFIMGYFTYSVAHKSEQSITQIGSIYMKGMNDEITKHFETTFNTSFSHMEAIVKTNPQSDYTTYQEVKNALAKDAKIRHFDSLALMDSMGHIEMLYGNLIDIVDSQPFVDALNNENKSIALSHTTMGGYDIAFGISCEYTMRNGETSTAIIACVPLSEFRDMLNFEGSNDITFSSIIRKDGSFVIKGFADPRDNFFDRISDLYHGVDGKDTSQYVSEIKTAIEEKRSYSAVFSVYDERRHLYLTPIPNSEWYLLTVMPYGEIEGVINDLSNQRIIILVISLVIIFSVYVVLFAVYYRKTSTQIKLLENSMQKAERASKAKSEFLSNMSHDIRTPMNAIVGLTTMASTNIDDREKLVNCLGKIDLSSKQLLGLINDILDMSKIESGKMVLDEENVSLLQTVNELVSVVSPQIELKSQSFKVDTERITNSNVYTDSVRLDQVILNLLSNAIKFTNSNGAISFTLYQEKSDKGDDYVKTVIIVKDNGIGMSEEYKKTIFDSFSREDRKRVNKTEGTGLGMAITKYIVDSMGGTIDVESEQGVGTQFTISIDFKIAPELETDIHFENEKPFFEGVRVLVAEDNNLNWEIANDLLLTYGFVPEHAENGFECVEKLKSSPEGYYSLILMDIRMPVMNGFEATQAIRKLEHKDKDLPIIAMSADAFSEDRQNCLDSGMNAHIAKPVDIEELLKVINKYLNER